MGCFFRNRNFAPRTRVEKGRPCVKKFSNFVNVSDAEKIAVFANRKGLGSKSPCLRSGFRPGFGKNLDQVFGQKPDSEKLKVLFLLFRDFLVQVLGDLRTMYMPGGSGKNSPYGATVGSFPASGGS